MFEKQDYFSLGVVFKIKEGLFSKTGKIESIISNQKYTLLNETRTEYVASFRFHEIKVFQSHDRTYKKDEIIAERYIFRVLYLPKALVNEKMYIFINTEMERDNKMSFEELKKLKKHLIRKLNF